MSRLKFRNRASVAVAAFALAAATSVIGASTASAGSTTYCGAGYPGQTLSGTHTYGTLEVTGLCAIAPTADITVQQNLVIDPGATLNPILSATSWPNFNMAHVHVMGNVLVGHGATLYLGCAYAMTQDPFIGSLVGNCSTDPADYVTPVVQIEGSVIASSPLTMALDGIHVHGNVTSVGGGPGPLDPTTATPGNTPGYNFPVKDNTIDGNLSIRGWNGGWVGAIRDVVGGNLLFMHNTGVAVGETGSPDSNEIVTNTISGNLICVGNNPANSYGDAASVPSAQPNIVDGHALGQCSQLTQPFPTS